MNIEINRINVGRTTASNRYYTVPELRNIALSLGLSSRGNKRELVNRILTKLRYQPVQPMSPLPIITLKLPSQPIRPVQPAVSLTPMLSLRPTISLTPMLSLRPTVSPTPMLSLRPIVSPTPMLSLRPTVSPTPTITLRPTVSLTPMLSLRPTPTLKPLISPTPTQPAVSSTLLTPEILREMEQHGWYQIPEVVNELVNEVKRHPDIPTIHFNLVSHLGLPREKRMIYDVDMEKFDTLLIHRNRDIRTEIEKRILKIFGDLKKYLGGRTYRYEGISPMNIRLYGSIFQSLVVMWGS